MSELDTFKHEIEELGFFGIMSTTIQPTDYPNDVTILEISCPFCGKISKLKVSTKVWRDGLTAFRNGALIQHAWPTLTPSSRELIKTGICDECWIKM